MHQLSELVASISSVLDQLGVESGSPKGEMLASFQVTKEQIEALKECRRMAEEVM